jgi:hypothetical protein
VLLIAACFRPQITLGSNDSVSDTGTKALKHCTQTVVTTSSSLVVSVAHLARGTAMVQRMTTDHKRLGAARLAVGPIDACTLAATH